MISFHFRKVNLKIAVFLLISRAIRPVPLQTEAKRYIVVDIILDELRLIQANYV